LRGSWFEASLVYSLQDLISKLTRGKWTGDVAQVVECLLCKLEALNSNPSLTKKKKNCFMIINLKMLFQTSSCQIFQTYILSIRVASQFLGNTKFWFLQWEVLIIISFISHQLFLQAIWIINWITYCKFVLIS
jgi:hypothetical protein